MSQQYTTLAGRKVELRKLFLVFKSSRLFYNQVTSNNLNLGYCIFYFFHFFPVRTVELSVACYAN